MNSKPNISNLNYSSASREGLVIFFLCFYSMLFFNCFKQLNPWNEFITETNRFKYIQINELKSFEQKEIDEFYEKIFNKNKTVKKFYLAMEFNKINNPEFYDEKLYSLSMIENLNRLPLYTPQINNISMKMPSLPVLYEWDSISKVKI